MTFEEFKRNFEIFAKIDSPEKLAICEQQYRGKHPVNYPSYSLSMSPLTVS
jgi:hypothetical protein